MFVVMEGHCNGFPFALVKYEQLDSDSELLNFEMNLVRIE